MIEPITKSFRVRRGDDWEGETFRLISPAGASFWANTVVRSQIRTTHESPTVAHEFTLTPVVTTEGANGVLTLTLTMSGTQSALLTPGNYVGDIEVKSDGFRKSSFCNFQFAVFADVTR
jgi:hypothetical protein